MAQANKLAEFKVKVKTYTARNVQSGLAQIKMCAINAISIVCSYNLNLKRHPVD